MGVFHVVPSLQVFPPKPCKLFSSPAHVPPAPPTRMTFGDKKYHKALQYVIFLAVFFFPPFRFSASYSRKPSAREHVLHQFTVIRKITVLNIVTGLIS